jgi:putative acyl-CoA dehydrogenase
MMPAVTWLWSTPLDRSNALIAPDGLTRFATHEVTNQVPVLAGYDLFASDEALAAALEREGGGWARAEVERLGALLGEAETIALGEAAGRHLPELRAFDRAGRRVDEVEYHPAYHAMMAVGIEAGIHSIPWTCGRAGGHVVHAALEYMLTQVEPGVCCPITMTYASVAALRHSPGLARGLEPAILARRYDPRPLPIAEKGCATIGMAMTEKQGGSDVRANTTRAEEADGRYRLTGHKWFCSAPMSDAFLTLAQAGGGLTCFLVPRRTPDGARNRVLVQRLKEKLGNRSNASAEIEYDDAFAERVGEEGRGIAIIMEMVRHTRLDAALVCAGMMRHCAVEAVHHAGHRSAFGRLLADQPLMKAVLADLVVEAEAALLLVMRVARAFDGGSEREEALARIGSAIAKFWITKRLPNHAYEALECLGGNGYVEDGPLARFYREAPVNAIWEGSGNVNALDVLRAMAREPATLEAWRDEVQAGMGVDGGFDRFAKTLAADVARRAGDEGGARRLVEDMALALQGSLVARHAPAAVAEVFLSSRFGGGMRGCYGALPAGLALDPVIDRARMR